MADLTAPSFSLGLDFDFDQPNDPNQQSPEPVVVDLISSQSIQEEEDDDDFDFQSKALDSDLQAAVDNDDTPSLPVLKRLKRGLPASVSKQQAPELVVNHDNNDDEIEDVDVDVLTTDGHSKLQNHSACSSSKFPSHGFVPLSTQFTSKLKHREHTQASNASSLTSTEKSNNKITFPKLTISPLRKFQLLDSDSDTDDASSSEDLLEDDEAVDISTSKRCRNANEKTAVNHQERDMVRRGKLQTEDLWKDFGPQKSKNIPTPALDDFCEEYFRPVKNKNVDQNKDKDIYDGSPKICEQNNIIGENAELFKNLNKPLPPAYKYFYHDDPRIKSLIRSRLPNFFPLGVHNKETPQSEHADIDYMCQFNQKEPTSRNKVTEGSSRTGRKTINQSNCKASEISGSWVNPKSYTGMSRNTGNSQGLVGGHSSGMPRNAGKRRVRAVGNSSGSWFTSEGGKKVYVAKNGQELSGRSAYCQYRKESGTGFKKSRKKVASKKKSKH